METEQFRTWFLKAISKIHVIELILASYKLIRSGNFLHLLTEFSITLLSASDSVIRKISKEVVVHDQRDPKLRSIFRDVPMACRTAEHG